MCPKLKVETSIVVVVKNRCQFCYAFHKDVHKSAEHSKHCAFRFTEKFRGVGGILKFACAVCFDVFESQEELAIHEELHRFPGGFRCSTCDKLFLNDLERTQHMQHEHEQVEISDHQCASYSCDKCGALFEQKTHLRLHIETDCGKLRGTQCAQCHPNLTARREVDRHINDFPINIEDEPQVDTGIDDNVRWVSQHDICKPIFVDESLTDPLFQQLKVENEVGLKEQTVDERDQPTQTMVASIDNSVVEDDKETDIEASDKNDGQRKTESFACPYCSWRSFSKADAYLKHVKAHGPEGNWIHKCYCCYTFFGTKEERSEHYLTVHPERVTCKLCGKKFTETSLYYKHVDRAHNRPDTTKRKSIKSRAHTKFVRDGERKERSAKYCDKCGKSFSSLPLLNDHEKSECGQSPYFKCTVCAKSFCNRYTLKSHEEIHKEKKFECPVCGKKFKDKGNLKVHSVTHTDDKPYECQKCDKRFADKSYLRIHMAHTHAEIKRYVCHGCGDRFPTNSALHKHRNTRKDTCKLVPIQPPPNLRRKS